MSGDLLVTGGRVVGAEQSRDADVLIQDGMIAAVGENLERLVDFGLGVGDGEEACFVGTGSEVDAPFEAGPEESLERLEVAGLNGIDIDIFQRTVTRFGMCTPVRQPLVSSLGIRYGGVVNGSRAFCAGGEEQCKGAQGEVMGWFLKTRTLRSMSRSRKPSA